jgi:hypothetical protein
VQFGLEGGRAAPLDGKPAGGIDSVLLVSSDEAYKTELPLTAAAPKGGLLSLKFEKVLSPQLLLDVLDRRGRAAGVS